MSNDPMLDTSEAYSINEFTGDGSTTQWSINFAGGYIRQSHVKAYTISPAGVYAEVALTFIGPALVQITPAVTPGYTLRIYRDTPKDAPEVNFSDGAIINESNLDDLARQSVFAAAEMLDRFGTVADTSEEALENSEDAQDASAAAVATANTASTNASAAVVTANAASALATATANQFDDLEEDVQLLVGADFSTFVRTNANATLASNYSFSNPVVVANASLSTQAVNKSQLDGSVATLTTAIGLKADTSTVNTALALKADASAMTTALAAKLDSATAASTYAPKTNPTISGSVSITGSVGTSRQLSYYTGASARWSWYVNTAAEGGSNAGSDFELGRYSDAGAYLASAIVVKRSTGDVTFERKVFAKAYDTTPAYNNAGNSASGVLDMNDGDFHIRTFTNTTTISFTNLKASGPLNTVNLHFYVNSSYFVNFPANCYLMSEGLSGGKLCTAGHYVLTIYSYDGGTNWFGSFAKYGT